MSCFWSPKSVPPSPLRKRDRCAGVKFLQILLPRKHFFLEWRLRKRAFKDKACLLFVTKQKFILRKREIGRFPFCETAPFRKGALGKNLFWGTKMGFPRDF
ncbi:MAG: hypothetical protein A2007_02655 [Verrucomicrobia bacterium GWC2_42_7]|nr:MAG: hypothetical protein A2007_02655 [Verrucomicrobia bacterium GWC2_42_7]